MQSKAFVKITTLLFHQTYFRLRTLKVFIKVVAKNPELSLFIMKLNAYSDPFNDMYTRKIT